MIVVGDTCTLMYLLNARMYQEIANYYGKIYIPEEVRKELKLKPIEEMQLSFNEPDIKTVKDLREIPGLDLGESAAICLYNEINANTLLTDDKDALDYCWMNNIDTKSFKDLVKIVSTLRDITEDKKFIYKNIGILFPKNSLEEV